MLGPHSPGYRDWAQTLAAQKDHLEPRTVWSLYRSRRREFLRGPIPSWEGAEPKGHSKRLRFLSPFVSISGERRINTLQLSHLLAYCLVVLMHVGILVLLSAKANCLDLLYFNPGNPKQ